MLPGVAWIWGLSRYAYVEGNPLIRVDRGHDGGWLGGLVSAVTSTVSSAASTVVHVAQAVAPAAGAVLDATTGIPSMINDVKTIFSGNAEHARQDHGGGGSADQCGDGCLDGGGRRRGLTRRVCGRDRRPCGDGCGRSMALPMKARTPSRMSPSMTPRISAEKLAKGCEMSFAASMLVLTPLGARTIASLTAGDTVAA